MSEIRGHNKLLINGLISESKTFPRPSGLNTVNLLKNYSTVLGINPNKTMQLAEKLYIEGYITYPRTEATKYSPSFDFKSNLNKFKNSEIFGNHVEELISEFDNNNILENGGIDMEDHPPITPSRMPKNNQLKGKEYELFKLIHLMHIVHL